MIEKVNKDARGGTELLIDEFNKYVSGDISKHFQIIPSRFRNLEEGKIPIYWAHDLVGDPECEHLKSGGYNQYERLVFVTNWQMQRFIDYYGIPWRKCVVIHNGIEPLQINKEKDPDVVKLIYHTTPHRGLEILAPVFDKLCTLYDNIELDVFSSFSIYGWGERDNAYQAVFEQLGNNKKVRVHGAVPYEEVRKHVVNADIFAYPSIWPETSCRSLMEAMSAGLLCVHSNYGALAETGGNWTLMYQYQDNKRDHANLFASTMCGAIENVKNESIQSKLESQSSYASIFYNWMLIKKDWEHLLGSILSSKGIK